jgi:CO/xanthine dehydrogenase Mo-binding subunit
MRGPGGPQITFALESHFDIIARELQVDPVKFRRDNAICDGDLSPIGERRKFIRCRDTLDAASKACGWSKPKAGHMGRGVALYEYPPGTYDRSSVRLVIGRDGAVEVIVGAPDTGTGFHTIVAQLVAEHFGIDPGQIRVSQADTSRSAYEKGASASRLTTTIRQAVDDAAAKAKVRLIEMAARQLDRDAGDLRCESGRFACGDRSLSLHEVMAAAADGEAPLVQDGENVSRVSSEVTCFAAQMAEVDVDRETGQVTLLRIVTAHDVGRVVNRLTHQGQIEGGLVQGIGQAMSEQLHYRDGVIVSASLGEYKMPCIKDIPVLETVLVPGEGGDKDMVKSIAEISNAAVIAAISNAVYDAVGVRLTELPISAERILQALQQGVERR